MAEMNTISENLGGECSVYISGQFEIPAVSTLHVNCRVFFLNVALSMCDMTADRRTPEPGDEGAQKPHTFKSSAFSIPTTCAYCKVCASTRDYFHNTHDMPVIYMGIKQTGKDVQDVWHIRAFEMRIEGRHRASGAASMLF